MTKFFLIYKSSESTKLSNKKRPLHGQFENLRLIDLPYAFLWSIKSIRLKMVKTETDRVFYLSGWLSFKSLSKTIFYYKSTLPELSGF